MYLLSWAWQRKPKIPVLRLRGKASLGYLVRHYLKISSPSLCYWHSLFIGPHANCSHSSGSTWINPRKIWECSGSQSNKSMCACNPHTHACAQSYTHMTEHPTQPRGVTGSPVQECNPWRSHSSEHTPVIRQHVSTPRSFLTYLRYQVYFKQLLHCMAEERLGLHGHVKYKHNSLFWVCSIVGWPSSQLNKAAGWRGLAVCPPHIEYL